MAEKIKYTRKDLKGPDEFISAFSGAVAWIKEKRVMVAAAASAGVLLLGGVLGAQAYFRWEENKATRDLWPHLNRAREILQAPANADPESLARLERFLTDYLARHSGTRASVYARYYLAGIAYLSGNYDLSASRFRMAASGEKGEETMLFLVNEGLGQALEAKGDFAGAAAAYQEAALKAAGELRTQARMAQARTLSLSGRKPEATALYRQILTESPDTPMRELIEIILAHSE